jgi:hypothetical protein
MISVDGSTAKPTTPLRSSFRASGSSGPISGPVEEIGTVKWFNVEKGLEVGNGAPVDLVRAGDDPAVGGLAKDFGQAHDRHRAGSDDVGQDLTRADGGELVDVADDQQRGMVGDGPHRA